MREGVAILMSGWEGPLQGSGIFSRDLMMSQSHVNTWGKREEPVNQALLKDNVWHLLERVKKPRRLKDS